MTPEVAREMIPILEAIARGVKVERRCEGEDWEPQVGTMILNDSWEFRIMPREFWIADVSDEFRKVLLPGQKDLSADHQYIKVREIL